SILINNKSDPLFRRVMEVINWLAKYKEEAISASALRRRLEPTVLLLVDIHHKSDPQYHESCQELLGWMFSKGLGIDDRWQLDCYRVSCLVYSVLKKDRYLIRWLVEQGAGTNREDF